MEAQPETARASVKKGNANKPLNLFMAIFLSRGLSLKELMKSV
jgi:hypothetical protein